MTTNIPTDPKVIGPGIWLSIHREAKRATDDEKKRAFVNTMKDWAESFPCQKCRLHINEYMAANPFEPYWNMKNSAGEEIGMFTWSWNFHNAVNTRLSKPYLDFDTAWNLYTDSGISLCTKGCEVDSPHQENEPRVNPNLLRALTPNLFS